MIEPEILSDDALAQIEARANAATEGPWQVKYMETTHRLGSPACKETCDKGKRPIRIEHSSEEEAARFAGVTEMHVHRHVDWVDDITAADGSHVFCAGHNYDEGGVVAPNDAEFIAHALEDIVALCNTVRALRLKSQN